MSGALNWGVKGLADNDTIICRCEDLTKAEVKRLVEAGYTTVEEVKRVSRCGMGPCQGRTCHQLLVREIAELTGKKPAEIAPAKARPPINGIKLGTLNSRGKDND